MSEEEKEAIKGLKREAEMYDYNDDIVILNLIEKQQKEIEKLKAHNKDLLRKLKNRVKEVKKLNKYSQYKKEFKTLNEKLQLKDKVINEMSEWIAHQDLDEEICTKKIEDCYADIYDSNCCKECVKEYFINKVKGE